MELPLPARENFFNFEPLPNFLIKLITFISLHHTLILQVKIWHLTNKEKFSNPIQCWQNKPRKTDKPQTKTVFSSSKLSAPLLFLLNFQYLIDESGNHRINFQNQCEPNYKTPNYIPSEYQIESSASSLRPHETATNLRIKCLTTTFKQCRNQRSETNSRNTIFY